MRILNNKPIFIWLPTIMTIVHPQGKALVLAWGYYMVTLKEE